MKQVSIQTVFPSWKFTQRKTQIPKLRRQKLWLSIGLVVSIFFSFKLLLFLRYFSFIFSDQVLLQLFYLYKRPGVCKNVVFFCALHNITQISKTEKEGESQLTFFFTFFVVHIHTGLCVCNYKLCKAFKSPHHIHIIFISIILFDLSLCSNLKNQTFLNSFFSFLFVLFSFCFILVSCFSWSLFMNSSCLFVSQACTPYKRYYYKTSLH